MCDFIEVSATQPSEWDFEYIETIAHLKKYFNIDDNEDIVWNKGYPPTQLDPRDCLCAVNISKTLTNLGFSYSHDSGIGSWTALRKKFPKWYVEYKESQL